MVAVKALPKKPQTVKFTLDCSKPIDDNILDLADLERYFRSRVKVDGKLNNLGEKVQISRAGQKLTIAAELPFSKRYVKYLSKKYLKRQQLRDFMRVVATNKNNYELRYFNTDQDTAAEE